jgi:hypothetical protein
MRPGFAFIEQVLILGVELITNQGYPLLALFGTHRCDRQLRVTTMYEIPQEGSLHGWSDGGTTRSAFLLTFHCTLAVVRGLGIFSVVAQTTLLGYGQGDFARTSSFI